MEDANIIYKSDIGFSFTWKRCEAKHFSKVNLVVKDTSLYLSHEELVKFSLLINIALKRPIDCNNCKNKACCKSILLETPMPEVNFIKSYKEILKIQDLVKGTLFQLGLNSLLKGIL